MNYRFVWTLASSATVRTIANSATGPDVTDLPRPTACAVCFAWPIPARLRSEADRHASHGVSTSDQGIDGVRDIW